jgi:biopolymer transport protein TolQ
MPNELMDSTGAEALANAAAGAEHASIWAMVFGSGPIVQGVLISLVLLSFLSWAIAIAKTLAFKKAREESMEFAELFSSTRNFSRLEDAARRLGNSPLARLFSVGYRQMNQEMEEGKGAPAALNSVERTLRRAELNEVFRLEKGLTFLATTASAAPFIGLFGTVWGIMNAFHGLGRPGASSTLQAVAPGISEALVATAVGLAAAIPAAIAYNFFSVGLRQFRESMDRFNSDFLSLMKEG